MKNAFLIGTTVYLRPLEREDAERVVPWFNDATVIRSTLRYRPLSCRGEEEFLDRLATSETDIAMGIVVRETEKLVGVTGFHGLDFKNRGAGFGIVIGEKEEWDKGYGTEATGLMIDYAFATLNLNRVWLHVIAYNERGIRAYEKVGFKKEGVLRQEHYREGRYWDTVTMAILREEWDTLRKGKG
jgi:RimJ/RimL family protein N-acetyltransferase